jgi:hypothetical protein
MQFQIFSGNGLGNTRMSPQMLTLHRTEYLPRKNLPIHSGQSTGNIAQVKILDRGEAFPLTQPW